MKCFKILFLIFLSLVLFFFLFFFTGRAKQSEKISWAVTFSQKYSQMLGLDWKENYIAVLDDLGSRDLRLVAYWDLIEKEDSAYDFQDLDWQINEAEKRNAKIMIVLGRKVPRWPECHEPKWIKEKSGEFKDEKLFQYIKKVVERYGEKDSIWAWQVENEPFFFFGECPKPDKNLLKKEIALVRSLDKKNRQIVLTESGEIPLWFNVSTLGDIVGHTLYRKVWMDKWERYVTYPLPPIFYARKTWLVNKVFKKRVICSELQAEPWGPVLPSELQQKERDLTMDISRLREIIEFAKNTGNDLFYLWGSEWWYWEKEKNNNPLFWDEMKILIKE